MMAKKKRKSYSSAGTLLKDMGPLVIIALFIGIPILLFGLATTIKFFTSPIINGRISMWWVIVGIFLFVMFSQRNKGKGLPPGY